MGWGFWNELSQPNLVPSLTLVFPNFSWNEFLRRKGLKHHSQGDSAVTLPGISSHRGMHSRTHAGNLLSIGIHRKMTGADYGRECLARTMFEKHMLHVRLDHLHASSTTIPASTQPGR